MTEDETRAVESSQRQHHESILYDSRMAYTVEQEELGRFALLKPAIYKDGNQWCVLYGADIQSGIVGFGETPNKAIWAWNNAWDAKV